MVPHPLLKIVEVGLFFKPKYILAYLFEKIKEGL
jgi:hypothetical protein